MSEVKQFDLRNIFSFITITIFIIGILLLTLAEQFGVNWLIGLGLVGAGVGFVIIIFSNRK